MQKYQIQSCFESYCTQWESDTGAEGETGPFIPLDPLERMASPTAFLSWKESQFRTSEFQSHFTFQCVSFGEHPKVP